MREKEEGARIRMEDKRAVLVVSFGTSHQETREKTLDVIERDIQAAFEGYDFWRAYTSPTILKILKKRDKISVDNVEEALLRLLKEGYKTVLVQTTHVIRGFEYSRMEAVLEQYQGKFCHFAWGKPLLAEDLDYREAVRILTKELEGYRRQGTDLLFMGHGTEHEANVSYEKLQQAFFEEGFLDCLVGTVEASPTLENMVDMVKKRRSRQVVLTPFLVVAGEHVLHDMAGEGENSWKSRFLRNGCQVECVMRGLGEYQGIREMYVRHAKEACRRL